MTVFQTTQSDLLHLNGKRVIASVPLNEKLYDRADVGDMFKIRLDDGTMLDAFADELIEEV